MEEPTLILVRDIMLLCYRDIVVGMVQWRHRTVEEAT